MIQLLREVLLSPRSTCLGCGSLQGTERDWLCSDCYAAIVPLATNGRSLGEICLNCGEKYTVGRCKVCGKLKGETLRTGAAYEYVGPIRNLVHHFKFSGAWRVSSWMAKEMTKACTQDFLNGVTTATAVPMHPIRRMQRGYNQSEKLARAFSKEKALPFRMILKRTRNTKQQVKLSMNKRRSNLTGAFLAKEDLTGQTVLLIDDVRTTGATAVECAKALLRANASEVRVLTFAKAVIHSKGTKKFRPDKGQKRNRVPKEEF